MSPGEDAAPAPDPGAETGRLVARALSAGDPTGWFEPLYAAAEEGAAVVPWDRGAPHWLLTTWAEEKALNGGGRRALVAGCGLGADAEHIEGRGFAVVAFDISASAIQAARRRFPGSAVDYVVADLLDPPAGWREAFDLVVESQTVQSLPDPPRRDAIARVGHMVAPGGALIVIALARADGEEAGPWPPWPITRAEVGGLRGDGPGAGPDRQRGRRRESAAGPPLAGRVPPPRWLSGRSCTPATATCLAGSGSRALDQGETIRGRRFPVPGQRPLRSCAPG
jgi:SAM-dependent methyltransferase